MTKTTFLLHVGLAKTASTTLQQSVFCNHPEIHYLGKKTGSKSSKACLNENIYQILSPILWAHKKSMNQPSSVREKLKFPLSDDRPLVASWEGLGSINNTDFRIMLNRAQKTFDTVRVLFVLRNPLTRIPSVYLQNLRGNFKKQNHPWMGSSIYLDFDKWYSNKNSISFNYFNNIHLSIEELGKENVGVFLFEGLKNNPSQFYTAIADYIGINAETTVALSENQHKNPRITEAQINYIRNVNKSWLKRILYKYQSVKTRKETLKSLSESKLFKVIISKEIEKDITNRSREEHQWLVDNLGLTLEKFDYPL
jgi:hypothetical protein